jgi:hypothetical protein
MVLPSALKAVANDLNTSSKTERGFKAAICQGGLCTSDSTHSYRLLPGSTGDSKTARLTALGASLARFHRTAREGDASPIQLPAYRLRTSRCLTTGRRRRLLIMVHRRWTHLETNADIRWNDCSTRRGLQPTRHGHIHAGVCTLGRDLVGLCGHSNLATEHTTGHYGRVHAPTYTHARYHGKARPPHRSRSR